MDSGAVIDAIQRLFQENKIKTSDVATAFPATPSSSRDQPPT